jgi:hypothetical protein
MSGYLRFLYDEILNCDSHNEWKDVFIRSWCQFKEVRAYYHEIKHRTCQKWSEISDEESWNLYSVSRVSDVMLLSFQNGDIDDSTYPGPSISRENYKEFFAYIGFEEKTVTQYHPFYCEVVEVIVHDKSEIELVDVKWPALMLGGMMFSRAGVVVKAPENRLAKGIADSSCLYWSFQRKYRKTCDLSMGWGSNSQWRTHFRRDFDLGDRYVFNVDGCNDKLDLHFPVGKEDDRMAGMEREARIEFLKNRCLTTSYIDDSDLWPFDDIWEEVKS